MPTTAAVNTLVESLRTRNVKRRDPSTRILCGIRRAQFDELFPNQNTQARDDSVFGGVLYFTFAFIRRRPHLVPYLTHTYYSGDSVDPWNVLRLANLVLRFG